MADIDNAKLVVSLEARVRGYERALAKAQADTNTRMKGIENALKKPQAEFQRTADIAARSLAKIEKQSATSASAIAASFKGIGAGLAGGLSVQAFVRFSDAATRVQNSLKNAGLEGRELTGAYERLSKIALQNGASFEAVASLYSKTSKAAKELGISSQDVEKFTARMSAGLRASGTDAQAASAGLHQLGQALGSGVLRGDELNSILENLPSVAESLAKGLGVTIGQLRQMGADGELTARRVFEGFMRGSEGIEAQAAKTSLTFSQAFTNIATALTLAAGEFNKSTGASQAFADVVNSVVVPAITGLGEAIGRTNEKHAQLGRQLQQFAQQWGIEQFVLDTVKAFNDLGNVTDPLLAAFEAAQAKVRASRGALRQDFEGVVDDFSAAMADLRASGQEDIASGLSVAFVGLQAKIGAGTAEARDFDSVISGLVNTGNSMADQVAGRLELIQGRFQNAGEAAKKAFDDAGRALATALGEQALRVVDALAGRLGDSLPAAVGRFTGALRQALALLGKMDAATATALTQISAGGYQPGDLNRGPGGGFLNFDDGTKTPDNDPSKIPLPDAVDVTPERRVDPYFSDSTGGRASPAATKTGEDIATGFIKKFEGYSGKAYWDVDAFRVGYGSDTVTSAGGGVSRVTSGTLTSLDAANRDLARRIVEFQAIIQRQVGGDVWTSFAKEQQAALTSIAYNYGELPDRIVKAIQSGNPAVIDSAIRGLGSDNDGINRDRRNQEADLFSGGVFKPATDAAKDQTQAITDLQTGYEQLGQIGVSALQSLATALSDGKLEGEELLQILLQVAQQLLAMPMPASAGGGSLLGNILGSLFGGFGGGGADPWSGLRLAEGGSVRGPGGPTGDRIPAMLSDGEHVTNARSARKYAPLLAAINADRLPHLAKGGDVGAMMSAGDRIASRQAERQSASARSGLVGSVARDRPRQTIDINVNGARGNREIVDMVQEGVSAAIRENNQKQVPSIAVKSVTEFNRRK
ncbi:tape measure protein [Mesorhizobium sp. LHD-90]|uniref:tape measure protein n=1 Tax=Mesorhizobium sp. LHD-90 TaxID=3071414 RepID=UPI0027E03306|nr:tape measure protein [Mesorhizobium sp. LHD-90]MDQ6434390.1 tape measure protein [Mesorhizobium sp. LHD-90]